MSAFSRFLPWLVAASCLVAAAASFSEVMRLQARIGELSHRQYHVHADVREFMIRAALADADQPIVVIGDSITEMAPLPRQLCGHPVINAGIGGMNIQQATNLAPQLLAARSPFMIALALGANDIGSKQAGRDFSKLLKIAAHLAPRPLVSISDTADPETSRQIRTAATDAEVAYIEPALPEGSKMQDGIHYTAAGYRIWIPALEAAIVKECDVVRASSTDEHAGN